MVWVWIIIEVVVVGLSCWEELNFGCCSKLVVLKNGFKTIYKTYSIVVKQVCSMC